MEDSIRADIAAAALGDPRPLPPGPWPDEMPLGQQGIGADSLERMGLAASLNEMFHIYETGTENMLLAGRRFGDWVDIVTGAHAAHGEHISFATSGSTGTPKRSAHRLCDLIAEAREHADRLHPARVLLAVPSHHIYGFIFGILVPMLSGCEVVDIRTRLPASRTGDLIVSFPDHWRYLARSLPRLPAVTGVTSTAPMPVDLARTLRSLGLVRLIEVYGASETAGIGWRDDPDAPFQLLANWTAETGVGQNGEAMLTGKDGRRIAAPDRLAWTAPGRFVVQGRHDGAVQVGGVNVYPARIAATLEAHALVAAARVRLTDTPMGGRLKALIVPADPKKDPDKLRQELGTWAERCLAPQERPTSFTIATRVPTGPMGKAGDWKESE